MQSRKTKDSHLAGLLEEIELKLNELVRVDQREQAAAMDEADEKGVDTKMKVKMEQLQEALSALRKSNDGKHNVIQEQAALIRDLSDKLQ